LHGRVEARDQKEKIVIDREIHMSIAVALTMVVGVFSSLALAEPPPPRAIPDRVLPVPDSVSLEMQAAIGYLEPVDQVSTDTPSAAEIQQYQQDAQQLRTRWRERFGLIETQELVGGVPCYVITPKVIRKRNRGRLLIDLHPGGFFGGAGESGTGEAIQMAALAGFKVLEIDYQLLPEHPYPAAMDDAMVVWRETVKRMKPTRVGLFGSSVGGGMVLAMVQRAKAEGLPLPGAVMSATPLTDMSKTGDSYFTNAYVDNTAVSYEASVTNTARLYPNGLDLKDPRISPVYGDFTGFPPTFFATGTRDLFLSAAVRVQEKLREAGVPTQLVVLEGVSHDQFLLGLNPRYAPEAPETKLLYADVGKFFDEHLGHD
jgi:monoterpene epsilon-lactone hydrolase